MKRKPTHKNVGDVFWEKLVGASCHIWQKKCPVDDCDKCIFDAPKDEFKEWLKKALEE